MQKIDKKNIESRFIKNLLKNCYLPQFPIIPNTGFMRKGINYTIGNKIFTCTKNGYFNTSAKNNLKCSLDVFCDLDIFPGKNGANIAPTELKQLCEYTPYKFSPNITSNFISTKTGYDKDTHRFLGDYLRYYKMMTGIDLMPLYNCNCGITTNQLDIITKDSSRRELVDKIQNTSLIYLIPVKLDSEYTLFFNNYSKTDIFYTFFDDIGRIKYKTESNNEIFLDDVLNKDIKTIVGCNYSNPIRISTKFDVTAPLKDTSDLFYYEKNFFLGIRVNQEINSPLYLIEGDHTNTPLSMIFSSEFISEELNDERIDIGRSFMPQASLVSYSSDYSIPYSDLLIGYLLNFSITSNEEIKNNILRIQKILGISNSPKVKKDIWSNYLKRCILSKIYNPILMNQKEEVNINNENEKIKISGNFIYPNNMDLLGYIDEKTENILFNYRSVN